MYRYIDTKCHPGFKVQHIYNLHKMCFSNRMPTIKGQCRIIFLTVINRQLELFNKSTGALFSWLLLPQFQSHSSTYYQPYLPSPPERGMHLSAAYFHMSAAVICSQKHWCCMTDSGLRPAHCWATSFLTVRHNFQISQHCTNTFYKTPDRSCPKS